MAVTSSTNKALFTGNGVTTAFSLEVKCFSTDEVDVYTKTSGVQAEVTTGITKAAITGDLANGVTVTFDTAPADDVDVILIREIAETQTLELEEGGNLPAKELENALDRNTMISQQVIERFDRSIQFPVSDPDDLNYEVGTTEERAGKALGFDASGNVTELDVSTEEGSFTAVDTNAGLSASAGTISAKVDDTTTAFSSGNIAVKAGGVGPTQLAANAVTTAKILDANVTKAKIENVASMKVLGNVSGAAAAPAEVAVIDDDTMGTAAATNIPTAKSVKAYVDGYIGGSFLHLQDEKVAGIPAGGSVADDVTIVSARDLHTVRTNDISATFKHRLYYDGQTANFTVGETITGVTSGATAVVLADQDDGASGYLTIDTYVGTFQDNETINGDVSGIAVVNSNNVRTSFTLAAGTYYVEWSAPQRLSNYSITILKSISGTSTELYGLSSFQNNGGDYGQSESTGSGRIVLTESTELMLVHAFVTARAASALGNSHAITGATKVNYAELKCWKLD